MLNQNLAESLSLQLREETQVIALTRALEQISQRGLLSELTVKQTNERLVQLLERVATRRKLSVETA